MDNFTNDEITEIWNGSKKNKAQLNILAELSFKSVDEIKNIVGYAEPEKKPGRYDWPAILREHDQGAKVSELSKKYGCDKTAVYSRLRQREKESGTPMRRERAKSKATAAAHPSKLPHRAQKRATSAMSRIPEQPPAQMEESPHVRYVPDLARIVAIMEHMRPGDNADTRHAFVRLLQKLVAQMADNQGVQTQVSGINIDEVKC